MPTAEPLLADSLQQPQVCWRDWLGEDGLGKIHNEVLTEAATLEAYGRKVRTFNYAGPALQVLWQATAWQWGFELVFPFIVTLFTPCPEGDMPFARSPILAYVFPALLLVGSLKYFEMPALGYTLCTDAMYCAPYKFLGWELSFQVWLRSTILLSCLAHADLMTNGLFLSTILKTWWCSRPKAVAVEHVWRYTIHNSLVGWIPFIDNFLVVVLFVWALMLLQPLMLVLYGWPYDTSKVTYTSNSHAQGYETHWSRFWELNKTLPEPGAEDQDPKYVLHHADILQAAGYVNRMNTIVDKAFTWCMARCTEIIDSDEPGRLGRAFNMMYRQLARITHRMWLVNVFEKGLWLEVQVTMFALSRAFRPEEGQLLHCNPQMLLSLSLSFMCYVKAMYDAWDQYQTISSFLKEVQQRPDFQQAMQEDEQRAEIEQDQRVLIGTKLWLKGGMWIMVFILLRCMTKLVAAWWCEDSLWDFPSPFASSGALHTWGCVDLTRFRTG